MAASHPYRIFFISDSAATIDFGNVMNEEINRQVLALFSSIRDLPPEGAIEAVPAYGSVTIYFDVASLRKKHANVKRIHEWIEQKLHSLMQQNFEVLIEKKDITRVPVCYENEFAIDLQWMAEQKKISSEEIVQLHCSRIYRVYMLGFLPGFAYMGEVDERISIPRKPQPQPITAGGVGIAGRQTGVYPLNSPGGWQIIGRTPLKLFDKDESKLCLFNAGDHIQFYPITKNEFENY